MRTWIIGNAEGSIGHTLQELMRDSEGEVIGTGTEVDVRRPREINQFLAEQSEPFYNIVYCAGIASLQWIKDLTDKPDYTSPKYVDVFGVNVFGYFNVMSEVTRQQSGGNVLALISDSSHVAMRGSIAYCASKAALHQAVKVSARELAPTWRVNGVSPSIVAGTRMTKFVDETVPGFRGWDPEEAMKYESSMVPLGRRATKLEVARVMLDVLMGPEFMTGTIVEMTGGK